MTYQNLDNLLPFTWQEQALVFGGADAAMAFSPDGLLLSSCDPLASSFEDWSNMNDLDVDSPSTYIPLELEVESPVLECSSPSTENSFCSAGIGLRDISSDAHNDPDALLKFSSPAIHNFQSREFSSPRDSPPTIEHRVLSAIETKRLRAIAMPNLALSLPSPSPSPPSTPELEPESQAPKRRKTQHQQAAAKPKAKTSSPKCHTSHNVIEKRYRNNLNEKIDALRKSVPSLRGENDSKDGGPEGETKLKKAIILTKAAEHISHLEKMNEMLNREKQALQLKTSALEMLIRGRGWMP